MPQSDTNVLALSTNGSEPAASAAPTPAPAPATPTQPAPEQQQGPFTVDQVRAWAEGKPQLAEQQGPFTVDQVKQWAERGTGPTETSEVLGKPAPWFTLMGAPTGTNIGRLVAQKGLQSVTDAVAGVPGIGAAAAGLARNVESPTTLFEGQSVAQVQAERDRLQGELAQLDKDVDQRSASGQLSGDDVLGATLYEKGLRQRLDAANQYIQSGGKPTEDWVSTGLKNFSGLLAAGQRDITQFGQREIPKITGEVPAEIERSPLGTAATVGAQIAAAVPLMAVDSVVATIVFGSQGFQNFYQDAKDHGADDRTAAISGLMGASLAPLQATMVEPPGNVVNSLLAKMLAGSTWKQGVAELATGALKGAAIQGGAQYLSNVTAHVAGYDPNRPLDAGVWQQALAGSAIDTVTTSIGMAGRRRAAQPPPAGVPGEVEIRTKPPEPGAAAAPAAAAAAAAPQTEAEIHAELQRNLDRALPETAPTPAAAAVPGETAGQLAVPAAIQTPVPGEGAAPHKR